jgi:hypothetical protein
MFPVTRQMVRPILLASLVLALSRSPAFAQRRMMPMGQGMVQAQMFQMPAFNSLYGNGGMPFSTGRGTNYSSTNPYGQNGLGSGMLGYGGYPLTYGMGGYGGYGGYGSAYGMAGAGLYGMPSVADYADAPDYYSTNNNYKNSPADLETALKEASSKPDRLSQTEKKANLRKRLDKYLYLPNDEAKQKSSEAP